MVENHAQRMNVYKKFGAEFPFRDRPVLFCIGLSGIRVNLGDPMLLMQSNAMNPDRGSTSIAPGGSPGWTIQPSFRTLKGFNKLSIGMSGKRSF